MLIGTLDWGWLPRVLASENVFYQFYPIPASPLVALNGFPFPHRALIAISRNAKWGQDWLAMG